MYFIVGVQYIVDLMADRQKIYMKSKQYKNFGSKLFSGNIFQKDILEKNFLLFKKVFLKKNSQFSIHRTVQFFSEGHFWNFALVCHAGSFFQKNIISHFHKCFSKKKVFGLKVQLNLTKKGDFSSRTFQMNDPTRKVCPKMLNQLNFN